MEGVDGNLYGVTGAGGPDNYGTVFKMTPDGIFLTLAFLGSDHWRLNSLIQGKDGNLYATSQIGTLTGGAIFRLVEPPVLRAVSQSRGDLVLTWNSFINGVYRVDYKSSLDDTNWNVLIPEVIAAGTTTSVTDTSSNAAKRYYRVGLLP